MRTNSLSGLLNSLVGPGHDNRPSIETFPDIDVNRIAAEMSLERIGSERGEKGDPPTGSASLDEVEARIVERVEAEKKKAHGIVEDELKTYGERLSVLDFEGRFGAIRQAAPASIGEFKAEVAKGLDELHGLRKRLIEAEIDRDAFRKRHKLERAPRVPTPASTVLKLSVLIALYFVEVFINGNFLAKGSEQGLLGGVTEAFSFAGLNIVVAVLLGYFGVIQLNHRSLFRKMIGTVSVILYLGFAFSLNLVLAHYRDVSAKFIEGGGQQALLAMLSDPFGLTDVNSWVFFGIGFLFSVIALIDGIMLSDPYPGYTYVEKRLQGARFEYIDSKTALIDDLKHVRDEYQQLSEQISRDLSTRRSEHEEILRGRSRLLKLFDEHQNHLERSLSVLLSTYREANIRTRSTKPPKRFSTPYRLERVVIVSDTDEGWQRDDLRARITAAQEMLTEEVRAINDEFIAAVEKYAQLDDLRPDGGPRGTA